MSHNELTEAEKSTIQAEIDALADEVQAGIAAKGLVPHASILFQEWSLFCIVMQSTTRVIFARTAGLVRIMFYDRKKLPTALEDQTVQGFVDQIRGELNGTIEAIVDLGSLEADDVTRTVHRTSEAAILISDADRHVALGRLGDLTGITHLEPALRTFLADHPEPERNVFIMMRFIKTAQFKVIHKTIVDTLAERGLHGMRADDRAYHGDLWANVEVHLTGCHLGIAVFEDLEERDHNPNVALELGYMKAKQRRTCILKERTLPAVPTDVVGALYKPFDKFKIAETVRAEVTRWIEVDLGIK